MDEKKLKNEILRGQASFLTEEAIAKQIMFAEIAQAEDEASVLRQEYRKIAEITNKIADNVNSITITPYQTYSVQDEMKRKRECYGTEFSDFVITKSLYEDDNKKLPAALFGEYMLILFKIVVEMIREGYIPFSKANSIINILVCSSLCFSEALRANFSGDYEKAKNLTTPELVAENKEEIHIGLRRLFIQCYKNIDQTMGQKQNFDLIKLWITATNIHRMQYGLPPLESHINDEDLNEIFAFAKEYAQNYNHQKNK